MPTESCTAMLSQLHDHLRSAAPLQAEAREHLPRCKSCSEVLRRAESLGALLAQPPESAIPPHDASLQHVAAREVVLRRRWTLVLRVAAIFVALYAAYLLWPYVNAPVPSWVRDAVDGWRDAEKAYPVRAAPRHGAAVTAIRLLLLALPASVALLYVRAMAIAPRKLYKRLVGHELSGVCRGISEASALPVWIVRMAFIVLFFATHGLLLYLILDLALPIHPEDRQHLLRFRIARWWKARPAQAA